MMRSACIASLTLLLLAATAAAAPGTWVQDSDGQWRQIDQPTTAATEPVVAPELNRVERLIEGRKFSAAVERGIDWLVTPENRGSPIRDRALFLVAQALFGDGDRVKAFYYLDELLDTYPESPLYFPALEVQYRIADAYLNGYRLRWLGMPLFNAEEEGVEMLYRIQARVPGSTLAEKALLRTADHYYSQQDYDFAGDAYAAFLRQYPRSPHVPRVRLRRAYASLAQFTGLRFDATPVIDGREQLRAIAALYPDLAAEEKVPALLQRIDAVLAEKLLVRADFYGRTKQPDACAYTLKYVMLAYPNSPQADQAARALARLPLSAQEQPGPQTIGDDRTEPEMLFDPQNDSPKGQELPPLPRTGGNRIIR